MAVTLEEAEARVRAYLERGGAYRVSFTHECDQGWFFYLRELQETSTWNGPRVVPLPLFVARDTGFIYLVPNAGPNVLFNKLKRGQARPLVGVRNKDLDAKVDDQPHS
jgi:hypothetical protein